MSQENVERLRQGYELFSQTGELDWDMFDPDVEFDPSAVLPDVGVVRGHAALQDIVRLWVGSFEDFRIDVEEMIDIDAERVVAVVRDGGRIRGTTNEVRNRFAHLWVMRHGKAVRWATFQTKGDALEAAGLSEQDAQGDSS